jgi:glyceraldehyde-3-phosphate dehydrogenase (NADP+)
MPDEFFAPISNQQTPPTYNFFDGKQWIPSNSGETVDVISPVDESVVGKLQVVSREDMDAAILKSKIAQLTWFNKPLNERIKIVHLAADWIRQYEEYLTSILVSEIGKTHSESKSEIIRTADLIDYFADESVSLRGETMDSDNFPGFEKGRIALIERVPYGVILCIAPFNYPINLAASKIAPALLMGNSVVFKPPTQGGIIGVHLTRIFEKAGVPEGVITCLTGGGSQIGDYLVSHPDISMVAFTGSSNTGDHIASKALMKPLLFECGGNNSTVVFPDADFKLTAKEIVKGSFAYSGQRCTAIKYVLASSSVMEKLVPEVLKSMEENVHMGDPRSPQTKAVGPVISENAAIEVEAAINESVNQGAKILIGGKRNKAYIEPTILTDVKADMPCVRKEVFGPVLSFIKEDSNEEIIRIINSSSYGLQACVFTSDEGTGIVFASKLNVGTVQVNGSPQRGPDHFPFLGIKKSGVGVQGVRYSLEAMSRLKPIVLNKPA